MRLSSSRSCRRSRSAVSRHRTRLAAVFAHSASDEPVPVDENPNDRVAGWDICQREAGESYASEQERSCTIV